MNPPLSSVLVFYYNQRHVDTALDFNLRTYSDRRNGYEVVTIYILYFANVYPYPFNIADYVAGDRAFRAS